MTTEQLARRNEAIRKAWDDPLLCALARAAKQKPNSKRSSRSAYNAYYKAYRARKRREKGA